MKRDNSRRSGQSYGFVSVVVVIVFVTVITMVVLGFAQLSRRNAREALDRQLSSQAYYAAETGINDVMDKVTKLVNLGHITDLPKQTTCQNNDSGTYSPYVQTNGYTRNNGVVDDLHTSYNVQYTCLLVDPTPSKLTYGGVGTNSVVVPMYGKDPITQTPTDIGTYEVSWQEEENAPVTADINNCPDPNVSHTNPDAAWWATNCPFGLLRVDIIPTYIDSSGVSSIGSPLDAAKNTATFFLYPSNSTTTPRAAATIPFTAGGSNIFGTGTAQGVAMKASCQSSDATCYFDVSGLNYKSAYMKVTSLYVPTPTFQVSSSTVDFAGAQVVIDVTGKAQDVFRRVRANVSINTGLNQSSAGARGYSDYTIRTTESVCKQYKISPDSATDSSGC